MIMDYLTAVKKVQTKKAKGNYLVISFDWSSRFILPYEAGIALLAALENAEQFNDHNNPAKGIKEIDRHAYTVSPLSGEEYQRCKIAALLQVSIEEIKEHETTN